ncbi:MAG: tRNA (adenosine(37)-N6)-threonylcarbamoyltransferase complex ATPase subunit type 1 TsaE [Phycisphaerales bacterium]
MPTLTRASSSEDYTAALARALAALLRPGDVVTLEGELGAGKTTLTRALATALAVDPALISSPTYVLVNIYPTRGPHAITRVVHADCYRMTGADDLDAIGWDQLFDPHSHAAAPGTVALVEWPSRIPDPSMLPAPSHTARITLKATGTRHRLITAELPDTWADREGFPHLLTREPTRCPTTSAWVSPLSPTYPFADQRARDADLYKWFSGQYTASRPAKPEDAEDEA